MFFYSLCRKNCASIDVRYVSNSGMCNIRFYLEKVIGCARLHLISADLEYVLLVQLPSGYALLRPIWYRLQSNTYLIRMGAPDRIAMTMLSESVLQSRASSKCTWCTIRLVKRRSLLVRLRIAMVTGPK